MVIIIIIIRCDKLYKRLSSSQYLSKWCNDKLRAEVKYETTENGDWKSRQCPPNNTQYNNGHTKTLEREREREGCSLKIAYSKMYMKLQTMTS